MADNRQIRKLINNKQDVMEFSGVASKNSMGEGQVAIQKNNNGQLALYRKKFGKLWKSYMSYDGNQYVDRNMFVKNDIILMIVFIILASIIISYVLGKLLNISSPLSLLIGIGNGICGASAIAGASSVIKSSEEDTVLSIAIINVIGALSIFILPALLTFLAIVDVYDQGMIIGSTIQAVGQVTAAGYILGDQAGETATMIKMLRIVMLGPILFLLSLFYKGKSDSTKASFMKIPHFIIGFILLAVLQNTGFIPESITTVLKYLSKIFLIFAMAAIGLRVLISSMINRGGKVFLLASVSFCIQVFIAIQIVT